MLPTATAVHLSKSICILKLYFHESQFDALAAVLFTSIPITETGAISLVMTEVHNKQINFLGIFSHQCMQNTMYSAGLPHFDHEKNSQQLLKIWPTTVKTLLNPPLY